MKKINRSLNCALVSGLLSMAIVAPLFTNKAIAFERNTGGHYAGEIREELKGLRAQNFLTPSDPKYSTQKTYSMSNVGDIETVWNDYKGKGTTVAIIDSGFAPEHEEYKRSDGTSAILSSSRYYYESGDSYGYKSYSSDKTCLNHEWDTDYSEWDYHGTATSTSAAAPINGKGGVGIAPEADILALKIDMSFAAIEGAIYYAIDQGVDVINMSLGAYSQNFNDGFGEQQYGDSSVASALEQACKDAYDAGIIVIAAAGNEATSKKSYPACNYHVIGVGALDQNSNDHLAPFSNFNQSETQGDEKNVDIVAPGFVYTALIEGTDSSSYTCAYNETQGTSFAAPIVAGAACLWKEKNPSGTPSEFEEELTKTAAGIGTFKDATVSPKEWGYDYGPYDSNIAGGRLDVGALLSFEPVTGVSLPTNLSLAVGGSTTVSATFAPINASNQNLNWAIDDENILSIDDDMANPATIRGLKNGTTNLVVTTKDGSFTASCEVKVGTGVETAPTALNISPVNPSIEKGNTMKLSINATPSDASTSVNWSSSDTNVATIASNGAVSAVSVGNATITATSKIDESISASTVVTVTKPTTSEYKIVFDNASSDGNQESSSSELLEFVTENTLVESFSNLSKVYQGVNGVKLGSSKAIGSLTANIVSEAQDSVKQIIVESAKYGSDSGTLTLSVNGTSVKSGITPGDTLTYDYSGSSIENITLSTSSKRAYISSITFVCGDTVTLTGLTKTGELNKSTYLDGDTFDPAGLTITANYDDGTSKDVSSEVIWSPTNLTMGVTSVTGTYTERDVSKTVSVDVTVNARPVTGVTLDKTSETISLGGSINLTATISPSNATNKGVTWSSSNESVATVNNGKVTGVAEGNAVITVTTTDGGFSATCNITVSAQVVESRIKEAYEAAKALADGGVTSTSYTFTGFITGIDGNSLYVQDGDYALLVYGGSNPVVSGAEVGKEITIKATLQNYGGVYETKTISSATLTGNTGDVEMAQTASKSDLGNLNMNVIASATGLTLKSFTNKTNGETIINFNWRSSTLTVKASRYLDADQRTAIRNKLATYETGDEIILNKVHVSTYNGSRQFIISGVGNFSITAAQYANKFLSTVVCYNGTKAPTGWDDASSLYDTLLESEKNILKTSAASESGDAVAQALARYDLILRNYSTFADFMNRNGGNSRSNGDMHSINQNINIVVTISLCAVAMSLIALYTYKKSKRI